VTGAIHCQEVTVHELGITQGIVDRAREAAAGAGAVKVTDLYLTITPAADFTSESIEMYYEMLTDEDKLLKGATLHFATAPVAATCLSCGEEFPTEAPQPVCPMCGSQQVRHDPRAAMVQLTDIGIDDRSGEETAGGSS
jgi:Zn finger protein HypA/HybF involved in hydrogenase expression